jgi:cytidyltransferase-like protein|tara:strand:+ start:1175 stop:1594 length:420 start_codon:yes stop_codon:yes gene_type:complete
MIIGYTDIVGDLFHFGHIEFLEKCKNYCDYLIVGICSDEFCSTYKRLPIMNENERLKSVSKCQFVDKVLLDIPIPINKEFMDKHSIEIVFHAHSVEENEKYNSFYLEPIKLNKFLRLNYNSDISTTTLINRINAISERK